MIGALWTGISGLSGQQTAIDNESHNIANVNTVGYKASRISFADQMYQDKIGKGTKILDAEKLYTQGSTKLTGVSYDMALSGDGFFAVKNNRASGTSETLYTRAGNFRMGDNGTLQDANGYEVQGWAMSPLTSDSVTSTNYNVNMFTSDYNKLVTSKVINHGTYVETVTAKTTDYNTTAKADGTTVFGGAGAKTKASKVSDVEELVKDYTNWLQKLKETPDGKSSNSVAQVTQINFEGTELKGESDQIYVNLNGKKIAQDFIATTASGTFSTVEEQEAANLKASQIATYKALADKISNETGFVAYNVIDTLPTDNFEASDTFVASTKDDDVVQGMIEIRAMIPGKEFTIGEVAETSGNTTVFGTVNETSSATKAVIGSGQGAVDSAKEALKNAVVGKQRDVYMPGVGGELEGLGMYDLNFQVTLYDKELKKNVVVPAAPLTMSALTIKTVDEVVNAINTHTDLGKYVRAENINGNLVVETLDKNSDIEFSSSLKGPVLTQEGSLTQTTAANPTTQEKEVLTNVSIEDTKSYQLEIAVNGGATQTVRVDNPDNLTDLVASLNGGARVTQTRVANADIAEVYTASAMPTIDPAKTYTITLDDGSGGAKNLTVATPADIDDFILKLNTAIATDGTLDVSASKSPTGDVVFTATVGNVAFGAAPIIHDGTAPIGTIAKTIPAAAGNTEEETMSDLPVIDSTKTYEFNIEVASGGVKTITVPNPADLADLATKINAQLPAAPAAATVAVSGGKLIVTGSNNGESIDNLSLKEQGTADMLTGITASVSATGDLVLTADNTNEPLTNIVFKEIDTVGVIDKNADYSGREGAGAEFLEIVNTIDQTASQGSLQLKLDALGISDSAFGEFSVDKSGLITMKQDGAEFAIGQVSVALFNNQRGLEPYGDNLLAKTNNSGDPIYNTNNERTANIQGKSLELSTADLSKSLVNLMVFQRAFEANAKSITTSDSLLNTLINLKR